MKKLKAWWRAVYETLFEVPDGGVFVPSGTRTVEPDDATRRWEKRQERALTHLYGGGRIPVGRVLTDAELVEVEAEIARIDHTTNCDLRDYGSPDCYCGEYYGRKNDA